MGIEHGAVYLALSPSSVAEVDIVVAAFARPQMLRLTIMFQPKYFLSVGDGIQLQ